MISLKKAWVGGKVEIGELASQFILDIPVLRAMRAKSQCADQAHDDMCWFSGVRSASRMRVRSV